MRATLCITLLAAIFAGLAATASAAPRFSVELTNGQSEIHRGDEYASYKVKITNTDTADATSGVTAVTFSFSPGVRLATGNVAPPTGWSCHFVASTCTTSAAVAPGASFPDLNVTAWIDADEAPDVINARAVVYGGGATGDAFGLHSLTLEAARKFEIRNMVAQAEDEAGDEYNVAGGHPFSATSSFDIPTRFDTAGDRTPIEALRDLTFDLPPGFIGNPEAIENACEVQQVVTGTCPESAAVGGLDIIDQPGIPGSPIYKVVPEDGYAAAFAVRPVTLSFLTYVLRAKVKPGSYGVTVVAPVPPTNPVDFIKLTYATLCGYGAQTTTAAGVPQYLGCKSPGVPGSNGTPFLTNPTECKDEGPLTRAMMDSYEKPGVFDVNGFPDLRDANWRTGTASASPVEGCEQVPFEPSMTVAPTTDLADSPSGLDVDLDMPQDGLLAADGIATAHLDRVVVELPEGFSVNPSAATGLEGCSDAQIALDRLAAPKCPDGSKLGTARVTSPLVDKSLTGVMYLATPKSVDPASGDMYRLWLWVANGDLGVSIKLAGSTVADPQTGHLTATFDNNPRLPFDHLEVDLRSGPRGVLATPLECDSYASASRLTSWSGKAKALPGSFEVSRNAGGGDCATPGFAPGFEAGTADSTAGSHSPFSLRIARDSGSRELKAIRSVRLPEGLLGDVSSVPLCEEAQAAAGSCPEASRVGRVQVAAGAGPQPFWVPSAGKDPTAVYLTGPYRGAPYGLSIVVPAQAGPFDLGKVVVRSALHVDERTAQITSGVDETRLIDPDGTVTEVLPDALPRLLKGIVLNQREIRLAIDREGFIINPTDCSTQQLRAELSSFAGDRADVASRFQAGSCAKLGFKPRFGAKILDKGRRSTLRSWHPRTRFTVVPRKGDANIGGARVALPSSTILDQSNIGTTCTRAQMAARACPAKSVVGYARAWSPLLRKAVEGPVYLAANGGVRPLPDLAAVLDGEIRVVLQGEVSTLRTGGKARLQNTFRVVPDAPVTRFVLTMRGGKNRGLLVNSTDLCRSKERGVAVFRGQNGRQTRQRLRLGLSFKGCAKVRRQAARRAARRKVARESAGSRIAHKSAARPAVQLAARRNAMR